MKTIFLALLLAGTAANAGAQALALPAAPDVGFAPAAGARLPLDAVLRDQRGAAAPLRAWFGKVPVVLVPGYWRCTSLCGTEFEGVLQALALSGLRAGEYRLLGMSIDPHEDGALARARHDAYAALLPGGAADLALLASDARTLARIGRALGYRSVADADGRQIAHAAGFVVAAPDGRIARFFPGVRFDPAALAAAVRGAHAGAAQAAAAPAAPPTLGARLALLCAHLDPAAGRHTEGALAAVRVAALATALVLGGWIWRRRQASGKRRTP